MEQSWLLDCLRPKSTIFHQTEQWKYSFSTTGMRERAVAGRFGFCCFANVVIVRALRGLCISVAAAAYTVAGRRYYGILIVSDTAVTLKYCEKQVRRLTTAFQIGLSDLL